MSRQNPTLPVRSSTGFSADLRPDPLCGPLISLLAVLSYLAGTVLLFQTRLDWIMELLIALLFAGAGIVELQRFRRRLSGVSRIRVFSDGAVRVQRQGQWHAGRVAAGGVLMRRTAWLRVSGPAGARVDCVCRESSCGKRDWRRFRLIYRHIGALR